MGKFIYLYTVTTYAMEMPHEYDSRILIDRSNTFSHLFWEDAVSRILFQDMIEARAQKGREWIITKCIHTGKKK